MTEDVVIYEHHGSSGESIKTVLTGADADAWRARFAISDEEKLELARNSRAAAYRSEADPLFFKSQRGEATTAEWEAKVAEIKARYPYPDEA